MTRVSSKSALLGLLAALTALACDGHDIAVFDIPAATGGGGTGGVAGSVAAPGGGDVAGTNAAPAGGGNTDATAGMAPVGGGSGGATGGGRGDGPSGGMQGTGGTPPLPCSSDPDCSPGWLCEKQGCDAKSGFCEPRPLFPKPEPMPVCGCDGITYWNDDIRRQAGAQVATQGECRITACACEVGADCKVDGASCSHLVAPGEACGHGMGSCWVLPPTCPPNVEAPMWQDCKSDPPGPCTDTCNAILSEKPYAPPHRGMTCN